MVILRSTNSGASYVVLVFQWNNFVTKNYTIYHGNEFPNVGFRSKVKRLKNKNPAARYRT